MKVLALGGGVIGVTSPVLADVLSGRKPAIDIAELAMSRYEQRFG